MRRTLRQIRTAILTGAASPAGEIVSRRARAALYLWRLGVRILRQWARDKCPQQAAALAFQTALSIVPVFAIVVKILRFAGALDEESALTTFLSEHVFPNMDDVTDKLEEFSQKISTNALGGGALLFTLVTCYLLYSYVEKIFNDIWRVGQRRSLVGKFLTFYAMVTLLPLLAGYSLFESGKLASAGAGATARLLAPLVIQFAAIFLMIYFLPRTHVAVRSAFLGALVSSIALEATKFGFVSYAQAILLEKYKGIYGSLGLVPLLLLWIYIAWLIILLGAEIAHAVQNLRLLEAEDRRRRGDEPINGLVAAQILAVLAADRERGGPGLSKTTIATEFALTPDVLDRIFRRLKARNLVAEVHGDINGFIPGRPAASIKVEEVLAAFRSTDLETAQGATSPALRALVADLEAARQQRIAGICISDLVPDSDPAPGRPAPG